MIGNSARKRLLATCTTLMLVACAATPERSLQSDGDGPATASQVSAEAAAKRAQMEATTPVEPAPAPPRIAPAAPVEPASAAISPPPSAEPQQASPSARPIPSPEPTPEPVLQPRPQPEPVRALMPEKTPSPAAPVAPPEPPKRVQASDSPAAESSAPEAASQKPAPLVSEVRPQTPAPALVEQGPVARAGHDIEGRITLLAGARQIVSQDDLLDAVIYFLPDRRPPAAAPGRFMMTTRGKRFDPALLVVPVGSSVSFPNSDPILHNVYSNTPGLTFDLGLYGESESRAQRFDRAGLVAVHCNVHATMQANIMVLDTPFFTRASSDGSFRLVGVPAGPGTLVAWHPRASALTQAMAVPTAAPMGLRLTASKPRVGR